MSSEAQIIFFFQLTSVLKSVVLAFAILHGSVVANIIASIKHVKLLTSPISRFESGYLSAIYKQQHKVRRLEGEVNFHIAFKDPDPAISAMY